MPKKYNPEFNDRAIRMVGDHQRLEQTGSWTALVAVGDKLGFSPHTLRNWDNLARRAASSEADAQGKDPNGDEAELRRLRRENAELRRANEILKSASAFRRRARPSHHEMIRFIDEHRDHFAGRADLSRAQRGRMWVHHRTGLPVAGPDVVYGTDGMSEEEEQALYAA